MSIPNGRLWTRNFTLLWQGQVISSIGKQMFGVAAMLYMKEVTGSGTLMGLVLTVAFLPMVVLGPVAGVMVDRWQRDRLIAWTDIVGGLFVLVAAVLFWLTPAHTGLMVAVVFAVVLATGLLDTFSQPAIGASIPDMVPASRLDAANGLNMAGIRGSMFVAQALAGFLFVTVGIPALVLINAITYLYAGISELFLHIPHRPRIVDGNVHPWHRFVTELKEGFRYVQQNRGLLVCLLLWMALNFFVSPIFVLLPFFVEQSLGLGPEWYGYLMAMFGGGSLVGFLIAGVVPANGFLREIGIAWGTILQCALMPLITVFTGIEFQVAAFFVMGMLDGIIGVYFTTILQLSTPPELRGRIQSLAFTISASVMPVGMALSGIVFDLIGRDAALIMGVCGVITLALTLLGLASRNYRAFLRYEPESVAAIPKAVS